MLTEFFQIFNKKAANLTDRLKTKLTDPWIY